MVNSDRQTVVLHTDTPALFRAAVLAASTELRIGGLVALPTETVYGLAANAGNPQAVTNIFKVKGRPANNPLIVHVASVAMARQCVDVWPEMAEKLAAAFWPGPLTLVLPRADSIPHAVTAGGETVGVRLPSHPFMLAVICECGFPLAAPSANLSNQVSPTNAEHVVKSLWGRIRLLVDGGSAQVGIESTVLDLTCNPPRILRPGIIHEEALMAVIGPLQSTAAPGGSRGEGKAPLPSPGLLAKHYAPHARLIIRHWRDEADLRAQLRAERRHPTQVQIIAHTCIPSGAGLGSVSVIPHDPTAFARALYATLHRCDEAGAELIVVEAVPDTSEWRGVLDRLIRAASD